ncbi:MAG: hypothetical protein KME15_06430 [Drouetiella hepatica Uher 2000/2452]|jgi:hypothetical protein|uniref:Uncharacterized protein n=1 Tax=Drouetiella hepatica Uher 2000/2452 TaxID=904376 RepID=A0A951Q8N4_9CYAN|nr:hypothetical protein [Drouetiella hepatica Uher 2000/2452]
MTTNLNQTTFPSNAQKEVMQAIATLGQKLPFLINLSQDERRSLPRMGDKTRVFIQKTMEVANQNSDFLPRSFEVANMQREVELYEELYPILLAIAKLHELVEDTYMTAGNEAYTSARTVYSSAKVNGRGIGVDAVVDDLGRRFSRKPRKSSPESKSAP